jgi:hypothetical protein
MEICKKYSSEYFPTPGHLKIGISRNVKDHIFPINGLRHPQQGDTSGWYIWAGDEYSDDPDFFVPLHISHLKDWSPDLIKFLALPPGYRFLIGENDYEDVWKDNSLLNI